MLNVSINKRSNKNGPGFLYTATQNYISARLLFLYGQLFDGGVFAHEAIEKIMKSLLYYKNPNRKKVIQEHRLNEIQKKIMKEFSINLMDIKDLFVYYEECYKYRYPDNPKPKSFGIGTNYIHDLDKVFIQIHDLVLEQISSDDEKYKSGIFSYCEDYFQGIESYKIYLLLKDNKEINIKRLEKAKEYWHKKGIYIESEDGITKRPDNIITKRQSISF